MKAPAFKQVDVFTSKPYYGNPVAVVIGAEELDTASMQRIASWTNLSETTFLLKSSVADYRLRIFTPRMELPFAGHPTIGSAHAVLESNYLGLGSRKELKQECGAGVMQLSVEDGKIFVKAPQPKITPIGESIGAEVISKPLRIDVGAVWVVAEVADAKTLAALAPDVPAVTKLSLKEGLAGITLFAKSDDCVAAIHVRSFAPAHGIPEDPVCGTGNVSVAAYLRLNNDARFGAQYVARQGAQCGRDGRVYMRVEGEAIYLGGNAVTTVDGQIRAD
jgi:PhzF family phenazine biosynthesis protein